MKGRSAVVSKYVRMLLRGSRWDQYERYLRAIGESGYTPISLEDWFQGHEEFPDRVVLLRHDVDTDPSSAMRMSEIEHSLGLRSTFYFRWCTFDLPTIRRIRENGSHVGFHYETLTHFAIRHNLRRPEQVTPKVISECRSQLAAEIDAFDRLTGECRSVAAHGDKRAKLIDHDNSVLLRDQDHRDYGAEFSADDRNLRAQISCWVSDGDMVNTFWMGDKPLLAALTEAHPLILFNTHPHHWRSGRVVVMKRVHENARFLLRHPLSWERGKPEAFARQRYLS